MLTLNNMNHAILHKPALTEKSLTESNGNRYTFIVPMTVTKLEFKSFIENKVSSKAIEINSKVTKTIRKKRGKSKMKKVKYMIVKLPKDIKVHGFETPNEKDNK